jgi:hypothetical protein
MQLELIEYTFNCPYCFSEITIYLDPLIEKQEYVEDCEVCCRPFNVIYSMRDGQLESVQIQRAD